MQTERGFDRLVNFSDAVVAIAITLLVLPLVDSAREFHDGNVADFLALNADGLFTFALSFVVIGNFWRLQHRLYESLTGYNAALLWATLLRPFIIVDAGARVRAAVRRGGGQQPTGEWCVTPPGCAARGVALRPARCGGPPGR